MKDIHEKNSITMTYLLCLHSQLIHIFLHFILKEEIILMVWFAIIHIFLHLSSYPQCPPFPNHKFILTIFLSTFFKTHLLLEAVSDLSQLKGSLLPSTLRETVGSCHITPVTIVLGLVTSALGSVLSFPPIKIPHAPAQPSALRIPAWTSPPS